jgi:hypothetical protein
LGYSLEPLGRDVFVDEFFLLESDPEIQKPEHWPASLDVDTMAGFCPLVDVVAGCLLYSS